MKNRTETARVGVRRKKLLRVLENETPAWKDADHTELAHDAAEFVCDLRRESDKRRLMKRQRAKK